MNKKVKELTLLVASFTFYYCLFFSLYSEGVIPYTFLKFLENVQKELKPQFSAIAVIGVSVCFNSVAAQEILYSLR